MNRSTPCKTTYLILYRNRINESCELIAETIRKTFRIVMADRYTACVRHTHLRKEMFEETYPVIELSVGTYGS